MTIDVATILEKAAAQIERCGWWQATDRNSHGDCVVTALRVVRPKVFGRFDAHKELSAFIGSGDPACTRALYQWNDAPGQTKENVIATMRACAAIWRAKHEERQSEAVTELSTTEDSHAQVATTV